MKINHKSRSHGTYNTAPMWKGCRKESLRRLMLVQDRQAPGVGLGIGIQGAESTHPQRRGATA